MSHSDKEIHAVVHLLETDTRLITQYPTVIGADEPVEVAAERVLTEQTDVQHKHFLVEDVVLSGKGGRHKEES